MALPTVQQVKDLSLKGRFNALTDAQVQAAIDRAALEYPTIAAEDEYETIVALHAAHKLASQIAAEGGGGGPLASMSLGPASKTFAVKQIELGGVDKSTPWGRELIGLLETLLPAVRTPRPVPRY